MPVEPQPLPVAPPPIPDPPAAPDGNPAPIWLQRVSLFILVIFCVYLGAIVTILPWWRGLWDFNGFFLSHPHLWAVMRLGPVRGIVSGLGLLDIWIGISEAIHYRDHRP